jgi:hypothetical protein
MDDGRWTMNDGEDEQGMKFASDSHAAQSCLLVHRSSFNVDSLAKAGRE